MLLKLVMCLYRRLGSSLLWPGQSLGPLLLRLLHMLLNLGRFVSCRHDGRRRRLMLLLHLQRRLRLRRNGPDLGQPLLFPLLDGLGGRIGVKEAGRHTVGGHLLAAHPGVEDAAPAQLAALETLELPVGGNVVVRQPGFGIAVTGWQVCDDAIWRGWRLCARKRRKTPWLVTDVLSNVERQRGMGWAGHTVKFVHLAAKEDLRLDSLILQSVFVKVLKDDDISSRRRGGFRSISHARGRLRVRF